MIRELYLDQPCKTVKRVVEGGGRPEGEMVYVNECSVAMKEKDVPQQEMGGGMGSSR